MSQESYSQEATESFKFFESETKKRKSSPLDEILSFSTSEDTKMDGITFSDQNLNSSKPQLTVQQIQANINENIQQIPPWVDQKLFSVKYKSKNAYFHSEILRFVDWIQMSDEELQKRYSLLSLLGNLIQAKIPETKAYMFGSTANRLAFAGSDIDVLIMNDDYGYSNLYNHVLQIIVESREFDDIDDIRNTAVPIIQAKHIKTGICVDLVMNRDDGLKGLSLVTTLIKEFPELRPMYFVIKAFLKNKNLHKPYTGGIGSFVLINMITFYLQTHYKRVGDLNKRVFLQDHIIQFFSLYGRQLRLKELGISIREGGFIFDKDDDCLKKENNDRTVFRLCIENPLEFFEDIGGQSRNITVIRKLFNFANDIIKFNLMKSNSFVQLIIPDMQRFKEYGDVE
eukprot:403356668